jgi:hypothetical protein
VELDSDEKKTFGFALVIEYRDDPPDMSSTIEEESAEP